MKMNDPAHPGAILEDTTGHSFTAEQLANLLGLTDAELQELFRGERDITPEMAERLPALYPSSDAAMWMRLQKQRDEWVTEART